MRHRVICYPLSLFFVHIEPTANNKEIYHIEYLKKLMSNMSFFTKSKIIYSNASHVLTKRYWAHRTGMWNLASNITLFNSPRISCMHSSSPFVLRTFPTHLILLDLISVIKLGEDYKLMKLSLYSCLQPPVTSSFLGSNMLLSTLFPEWMHEHVPRIPPEIKFHILREPWAKL
jgi:hypothetical protein